MYFGNVVLPKGLIDPNSIVPISASTALSTASYGKVFVISAPGTFTITVMPLDSSNKGNHFILVNDSTGTATINASGSDVFHVLGASINNFSLGSGDTVTLENNGANWTLVGNSVGKANLVSPVFTGTPLATTPAQFDDSTKLATTAFVNRFGLQASRVTAISANTTLTAADVGSAVNCAGASGPYTVTLPALTGLRSGSIINFVPAGSAFPVTITCAGTDKLSISGVAPSLTSVTLNPTDSAILMVIAGVGWYVIGGSVQLGSSGAFGSSLGDLGWQKLPSGLIIQWGSVNNASTATSLALTFPIAFPTQCKSLSLTSWENGQGTGPIYTHFARNQTGATVTRRGTAATYTYDFLAVGY